MSKKVVVKFCTGTLCHVMGGGELHLLIAKMPAAWVDKVVVEGLNCHSYCKNRDYGLPPFATINDKLISEASMDKVIGLLKKEFEE